MVKSRRGSHLAHIVRSTNARQTGESRLDSPVSRLLKTAAGCNPTGQIHIAHHRAENLSEVAPL